MLLFTQLLINFGFGLCTVNVDLETLWLCFIHQEMNEDFFLKVSCS